MSYVTIKGLNKSLVVNFTPNRPLTDYINDLAQKIDEKPEWFQEASILFEPEAITHLSRNEIAELQRLCLDKGMLLENTYKPVKTVNPWNTARPAAAKTPELNVPNNLIINRTLRSGQKVQSEGTVVICGNVNESAEITAGGDVIVLGKLEGIVHAGCFGKTDSFIFALFLAPSQLRITDHISRSSGELAAANYPEIAYLEGDNIFIKRYNPRELIF